LVRGKLLHRHFWLKVCPSVQHTCVMSDTKMTLSLVITFELCHFLSKLLVSMCSYQCHDFGVGMNIFVIKSYCGLRNQGRNGLVVAIGILDIFMGWSHCIGRRMHMISCRIKIVCGLVIKGRFSLWLLSIIRIFSTRMVKLFLFVLIIASLPWMQRPIYVG